LRTRQVSQDVAYVMTLPSHTDVVARLAEEHLFN
jgi:hypothetical protein